MPKLKTQTLTAPALWASAMVNMDYSGLTKEDTAELNNWLLDNGLSFVDCLNCSDEYISRFDGQLCNVCDYTYKA